MKKSLIIISLMAATAAFAGNDTAGNCGNGSGAGNGCTQQGGTGGSGGSGGAGGNGGAGGAGGSAKSKASSTSRANAVAASIATGGKATGGSASATGGSGGSALAAGGFGVGEVTTSNTNNYHAAASSAFSPAVYPTVNCALATSVGLQGVGGGISIGGTHIDESCQTIEQAKALAAFGKNDAAQEVLCELPKIRAARKRTGDLCAVDRIPAVKNEPTDPYVRARLGLPALAE